MRYEGRKEGGKEGTNEFGRIFFFINKQSAAVPN